MLGDGIWEPSVMGPFLFLPPLAGKFAGYQSTDLLLPLLQRWRGQGQGQINFAIFRTKKGLVNNQRMMFHQWIACQIIEKIPMQISVKCHLIKIRETIDTGPVNCQSKCSASFIVAQIYSPGAFYLDFLANYWFFRNMILVCFSLVLKYVSLKISEKSIH